MLPGTGLAYNPALMDPDRSKDLVHDISQLRRSLEELGADGAPASRPEALQRAREATTRLERASKTQRLDLASFFEMAGQINAQGLDLDRIESYAISLMRGRTSASTVSLLRATTEEGCIVTTRGVARRLELSSALARKLTEIGKPVDLVASPDSLGEGGNAFSGAAVVAPLIQQDSSNGSVLRGLLVLGKKVTGQPYFDRDFEFVGLISELIAIALHNAFLHYLATHDALTETWSRGHFDVELKRELNRTSRRRAKAPGETPGQLSLVMIDLDHFKLVNDTYGHRAGDRVLKAVAQTLRRAIRDYDTLARWGGEEFAIVLTDTGKKSAIEAAERFRKEIAEAPVQLQESEPPRPGITASMGVATYPDDATDPRELLQKADMALYRSKEGGRNRVTGS
ncbi:sensor domain-containing diguanylate cyclase [bacterium]|nr:sensor domain-containing diguanylate cyclase [bacterium]